MTAPVTTEIKTTSANDRYEQVSAITQKAVDDGYSYMIRTSRKADEYLATVTVYPEGADCDL